MLMLLNNVLECWIGPNSIVIGPTKSVFDFMQWSFSINIRNSHQLINIQPQMMQFFLKIVIHHSHFF